MSSSCFPFFVSSSYSHSFFSLSHPFSFLSSSLLLLIIIPSSPVQISIERKFECRLLVSKMLFLPHPFSFLSSSLILLFLIPSPSYPHPFSFLSSFPLLLILIPSPSFPHPFLFLIFIPSPSYYHSYFSLSSSLLLLTLIPSSPYPYLFFSISSSLFPSPSSHSFDTYILFSLRLQFGLIILYVVKNSKKCSS